jgi:prepilin-type N-terminal cleavage/methylation domain-containing protein
MRNALKISGYTLVEMLVAISIFAILMLAVSTLFLTFYRQQSVDMGALQSTHDANYTLDLLSRELRRANRGENGNYVLIGATASALSFYSDIDNDGATEKVAYALSGTELRRTLTEPGADHSYAGAGTVRTVCANVRNGANPIFTYYDENYTGSGSAMASPIEVVRVGVVGVALDLNPANRLASYPLHAETKVKLRNIK